MPCQPNEACFNEHPSPLSHTALVHAKTKIEPIMFGRFVGVETVVSKQHNSGWLYLLRSDHTQTYEALEEKLKKLNANISQEKLFHVIGPKGDIIVLGGCHPFLQEIINDNGEFCTGVDVWRTNTTLPPRKRVISSDKEDDRTTPSPPPPKPDTSQLLIPGFKRLSRQLQVDFSVNVHGSEGKRRREPVRSIYEEAALEANKKKRVRRQQAKRTQSTDNESSDFDECELTKYAEMLASMSTASGQVTPDAKAIKPSYKTETSSVLDALARAIDVVTKAHTHTIQSKDDTIRAMETTTKALQDTIASQTALIAELLARI